MYRRRKRKVRKIVFDTIIDVVTTCGESWLKFLHYPVPDVKWPSSRIDFGMVNISFFARSIIEDSSITELFCIVPRNCLITSEFDNLREEFKVAAKLQILISLMENLPEPV